MGPYEILGLLGVGGMGEVYRARDPRLGREVAIKVLPSAAAVNQEQLRRFEQEARAAGSLNHPNILAIFDIGTHEGRPYVVSELLEGETLREKLPASGLPLRKALDYALQIAQGLAAAHEKGVIHRDLKPENLFVTKDGRVKILDFGLAKLVRAAPVHEDATLSPSMAVPLRTEPGVVMGTVGYMSPEQVRGRPLDHRSDIFSFGVILFEMLTGRRAFRGESAVETLNAILTADPMELGETDRVLPPGVERFVRHCLEKNPDERFHSARDLAFHLESMSYPTEGSAAARVLIEERARRRLRPLLAAVAAAAALAGAFFAGDRLGFERGEEAGRAAVPPGAVEKPLSFRRLTFRRGTVPSARFAPDGHTIVFSAAWDGKPVEVFSTRRESAESRSLGLPGADILAISSSGEMALSLSRRFTGSFFSTGLLARAPLAGGAPRELLEDVRQADWGPDGEALAVAREVGGRHRLELPIGKVLYETTGWVSHPRVSPKGDLVAFLDHPIYGDDRGDIAVVDLKGKRRTLSSGWNTAQGLAWAPGGGEILFAATKAGVVRSLHAVDLAGRQRRVAVVPGNLTLHDISRDGRILVSVDSWRSGVLGLTAGQAKERNLSWFDGSLGSDLSADGKLLLLEEPSGGAGASYSIYLRKTDGSPAVRLGDGVAGALSPDGKWATSITLQPPRRIVLLPTGPGVPRTLGHGTIEPRWARWFPDGQRLLFAGQEPQGEERIYVQDLSGGAPRPLTLPGASSPHPAAISPDGKRFALRSLQGKLWLFHVEGGQGTVVPGAEGHTPTSFSADGRWLYVYRDGELPLKVLRMDPVSGRKKLWKELMPSDPAGVRGIPWIVVTPDGKSYAYTYLRFLSDLYLVEGWL